nr:hypothetical protein [Dyadobacter bucti]
MCRSGIVPGFDQIVGPMPDDLIKVVNIIVQVVDDIVFGQRFVNKHAARTEEKLDV